jgi:hypothetical protein
MEELPDVIIGFTGENWDKLGMCPIFLARLMEMGWSQEEISKLLGEIIGPDFSEVNCTTWINRLEFDKGIECSDYKDEPPFRILLDRIMFCYLQTGKLFKGDFYIKQPIPHIDENEFEAMTKTND